MAHPSNTNSNSSMEQFENYEAKVKSYTQLELLSTASDLFMREKKIGDAILVVLSEIQNRRMYSELGFSSLFEMLVKHFKLSESGAYQKISVINLIKDVPAAKDALVSGSASVSNLVLAHTVIKDQNKNGDQKLTEIEKNKIIDKVKDKSNKKAKEDLAALFPQLTPIPDKINPINQNQSIVKCTIDKTLQEKLEQIKNLVAHKHPNPSINELLHIMADITIAHIEKKKGIESHQSAAKPKLMPQDMPRPKPIPQDMLMPKPKSKPTTANQKFHTCRKVCVKKTEGQITPISDKKRSRHITKKVKQIVFKRAEGRCQYISSEGRRCECKKFLEFDHILPFAKGGLNDSDSLQLFCSEHNALKARQDFGKDPRDYKSSKNHLQS